MTQIQRLALWLNTMFVIGFGGVMNALAADWWLILIMVILFIAVSFLISHEDWTKE
jgi:uncharacterized membrane protein